METFIKEIDNYLIKTHVYYGNDYHEKNIHASQIGNTCRKFHVLSYINAPKREETFAKRLMYFRGNKIHELVREALEEAKDYKLVLKDFNVSDWLPEKFSGSLDMVVERLVDNKNLLIEIKTAMPNQFKEFSSSLPHEHHIKQIRLYDYALLNAVKEGALGNIDELWLIYFDSAGTNYPLWFNISRDIQETKDLIREIESDIYRYRELEELPEKIKLLMKVEPQKEKNYTNVTAKMEWNCSYCDFKGKSCDAYSSTFDKPKVVGRIVDGKFQVHKKYADIYDLLTESFIKHYPLGV